MNRKHTLFLILCTAFFVLFSGQAFAQEANTAEGTGIQIKLKAGSEKITVNGEQSTIEKPFEAKGTTLVPLRVITSAFSAKLSWDSKTQTIGLTYGTHAIQLQIGSTEATADGKTTILNLAPQMKNNTTMVPIRFIIETFGAKVVIDPVTKEITITGTLANAQSGEDTPVINTDAGKTKIGDSHFGWTMNYPSGLVKDFQSFKGDIVLFKDAKEEYEFFIYIQDEQNKSLSKDGLLKKLSDFVDEGVLSKKIVEKDGSFYAAIISRSKEGEYTEYRAFLVGDKIHIILISVAKEADFKNQAKYQVYKELLDSYTPSFNSQDKAIKDISLVKSGYLSYARDEYGLSVKIPADWHKSNDESAMYFYNEDESQYLSIRMTSLTEGDTLNAWVARQEQLFSEAFLPHYRSISANKPTTVAGVPAVEREYSYSLGIEAFSYKTYYFIKGDYKFYFSVGFKTNSRPPLALFYNIANSISVDTAKMDPYLGIIEDPYDFMDKSETLKIESKKYNYSVEIPEFWSETEDNNDADTTEYSFLGGSLGVYVVEDVTFQEGVALVEDMHQQYTKESANYKLISTSTESINGITAKKFVIKDIDEDGDRYQTTTYVVTKGNLTYYIDLVIYDAVRTPENEQHLNDAFMTFTFLN